MAPDLAQLRQWISVATLPVYFLVAWAFYRRKLWRPYLFFWICLLVEGLGMGATLLSANSRRYTTIIYMLVQPPTFLLYVLMVLEVFQKVFARFPGIARFAQRVVVISLGLAFLFALTSLGGDLSAGWTGQSVVSRYSVVLRAIASTLSIYMILISIFLIWMPVPLPPNTIRHSFLFFFYFMLTSGVYYFLNLNRSEYVQIANFTTGLLTLATLLAWYFLVQPEGEIVPKVRQAPHTPAGVLLGRLEALNQTLSRPQE